MKNYFEKLSKQISFKCRILFYSMWSGYLEDKSINFSKWLKTIKLHTRVHAYEREFIIIKCTLIIY